MENSITAQIIADSSNSKGCRLTTFILRFPRIVLAEYNTHRAFSRNSSSSRAIPFEKMLEMVKSDPFIPIAFQKDHKGMQGVEYFEESDLDICVSDWLKARDAAVTAATGFRLPVTKQLRNRLLEPFMWQTVIMTATDFQNFFSLRAHKDAEIHIEALAYKMLEEYNKSEPKKLLAGEWHIPFGDKIDAGRIFKTQAWQKETEGMALNMSGDINYYLDLFKCKIAISRCARVSYLNFEGKDDYEADIKLCDRLFGSTPRHLSPTEHVAQCMDDNKYIGNFQGFKQYRYMFKDQNSEDNRVLKK